MRITDVRTHILEAKPSQPFACSRARLHAVSKTSMIAEHEMPAMGVPVNHDQAKRFPLHSRKPR